MADATQVLNGVHDVVAACLGQPSCKAVTFGGITDKYSWLNYFDASCADGQSPRPRLFDDYYQKKPATRAC